MRNSPQINPYSRHKNALVFSFDKDLLPFFNYSKGWHRQKIYFDRPLRIVNEIRGMMRRFRATGGRVFIDNAHVYFVDASHFRTDLCELRWPNRRDVIPELRSYWARKQPIRTKGVLWNGSWRAENE